MARARARTAVLQDIAMHMLEVGHVMTKHNWEQDTKAPIRVGLILNLFGNWSRMLGILENEMPDAWKQINTPKEAPKPKIDPKPKAAPKKDPLESLSKPASAAAKVSKDDE
jgi:hypothetical protein